MEKVQANEEKEQNYRINIKQNVKGFCYFDVTVRSNDEKELNNRLNLAITLAKSQCDSHNQIINQS